MKITEQLKHVTEKIRKNVDPSRNREHAKTLLGMRSDKQTRLEYVKTQIYNMEKIQGAVRTVEDTKKTTDIMVASTAAIEDQLKGIDYEDVADIHDGMRATIDNTRSMAELLNEPFVSEFDAEKETTSKQLEDLLAEEETELVKETLLTTSKPSNIRTERPLRVSREDLDVLSDIKVPVKPKPRQKPMYAGQDLFM